MTIKGDGIRCPTFWLWKSVPCAADGRVTILLHGDFWDSEISFCSLLEGKQRSLWSTILDWYSGQIQDFQCEVSALVPLYLRGFELFWIEQDKNLILSLPCVCISVIRHDSLVASLFPLTLYLSLVKPLSWKSAFLGNTLEMLKLLFNTTVLVNSGICFIKGKWTLPGTLGASSWFSTQMQAEKGYAVEKNGLIISYMWNYLSLLSFFNYLMCFFPLGAVGWHGV